MLELFGINLLENFSLLVFLSLFLLALLQLNPLALYNSSHLTIFENGRANLLFFVIDALHFKLLFSNSFYFRTQSFLLFMRWFELFGE